MKQLISNKYFNFTNVLFLAFSISALNCSVRGQNKPPFKKYKIQQEVFRYKLGNTIVKIVVSKTSKRPPALIYFNMHDNENTSVEAAKEILEKYGGTLIELENGGKRLIKFCLKDEQFTFDPNRIFTKTGIEKTLKYNGGYANEAKTETSKFAGRLESFIKDARIIVALHNNTDENYSIKSYEKGEEFEKDAKLVGTKPQIDTDDFFYVTDENLYKKLQGKNQNVALQDNANVTDDGSLAVYCGKRKISYVNVESEHGHLPEQKKMLEILRELTKDFGKVKKKIGRK